MRPNLFRGLFVALGIIAVSACNYPGMTAPTPFIFPTPNLTLTAVFNPTPGVQPTGGPVVVTATPEPTQMGEPATATSQPTVAIPTATATLALPTAAPTSTPAATQSLEGPGKRPKFPVDALYFDKKPTIDGIFSEWDQERYPVDNVVFGADKWTNSDDLSANVMLGWDEDNLYMAVRVHDDIYAQNASGEDIFKGDSLDILVDTDVSGDYYRQSLSADDFQLGISPGSPAPGDNPKAYLWYPTDEAGTVKDVEIGATSLSDGYRVEVAIPWSVFDITPQEDDHYGFVISVSDNDNVNKDLQQSMVSNDPNRLLTDPTTWGDLHLVNP